MRLSARLLAHRELRVLVALAALFAALAIASASARAAKPASYRAVVAQIERGPVTRAVINPPLRHVEIKFRDLSEWLAVYPPGAQPQLQRLLRRRHIHVVFASPHRGQRKAAIHHGLRYIAAGVLVAVLGAVAMVLALDGRSRRRSEPQAQTPA